MTLECKANCGKKLKKAYVCDHCSETFHKNCGKLKKTLDKDNKPADICVICLSNTDIAKEYTLRIPPRSRDGSVSSAGSQRKRLRRNTDSSSESGADDSSEADNVTLADLAKLIKTEGAKHGKRFTKLEKSINELKHEHKESEARHIEYIETNRENMSEMADFRAENPKELIFAGHLLAGSSETDLKNLVLDIVRFLGIDIGVRDIRQVRLLKAKNNIQPVSQGQGPPPIVATFYSSSLCLKILDAKREKKIITNADVTVDSTSNKKIFINVMLHKRMHQLLQLCKSWARENNYKHAWYSQGRILVKMNDNSNPVEILTKNDLLGLPKGTSKIAPSMPKLIEPGSTQANVTAISSGTELSANK